jgi:hypothetical protein
MRDAYLQLVRQASGVEERVLLEVLRGTRVGGASGLAQLGVMAPRDHAEGHGGESRISAESVIGSADALPVTEILRGVLPQEAELLRLLLLVPEFQLRIVDAIGPDQLPSTVARELFRAVVLAREPDDAGVHPPFSLTALVQSLDPETAALAQAVLARRDPNPRDLSEADLAYEVDRLTIDLEERALDERSEYLQSALAEAEGSGDRSTVDQLVRESQGMNDQRLSLHRRRDQTKLITTRR